MTYTFRALSYLTLSTLIHTHTYSHTDGASVATHGATLYPPGATGMLKGNTDVQRSDPGSNKGRTTYNMSVALYSK